MARTMITITLTTIAILASTLSVSAADRDDAFLASARSGDVDRVQPFLADGADANVRDDSGNTALHYAAAFGYTEMAQILVDAGADVDAQGRIGNTPLHLASQEGHSDVVAIFIDRGADLNAENEFGGTALAFASGWGHRDIVDQLQRGSQPSAVGFSVWFAVLVAGAVFAAAFAGSRLRTTPHVTVVSPRPATFRARVIPTIPHHLPGAVLSALHSNGEMAS